MHEIEKAITKIQKEVKDYGAKLVAISKTKPNDLLQIAYDTGQLDFGENKVQEMTEKQESLPKDIRWHMVGHLQRNKVKYIAPYVALIHSVDSVKLLKALNKEGKKCNRTVECLLQVHIAEEATKFGFDEPELLHFLDSEDQELFDHVKINGLMGMATFTENKEQITREFSGLKKLYDRIAQNYQDIAHLEMQELSMGMSGDYQIALDCGSTMVRIGSTIFGERNYG